MMDKKIVYIIALAVYFVFIIVSMFIGYSPGIRIYNNFASFAITLFKIIPCAFVLIALFEVWVKKETVEKKQAVKKEDAQPKKAVVKTAEKKESKANGNTKK